MTENKTTKTTYKDAVKYALDNLPDAPADVREKLDALVASFEKKSENRKPAAEKEENIGYTNAIHDYLLSLPEDEKKTVTDIIKECPAVAGFSTSKVTSLLSPLVENGKAVKLVDKRRSYYKAVR